MRARSPGEATEGRTPRPRGSRLAARRRSSQPRVPAGIETIFEDVLANFPELDPYEAAVVLLRRRVCGAPLDAQRSTRKTCSDSLSSAVCALS